MGCGLPANAPLLDCTFRFVCGARARWLGENYRRDGCLDRGATSSGPTNSPEERAGVRKFTRPHRSLGSVRSRRVRKFGHVDLQGNCGRPASGLSPERRARGPGAIEEQTEESEHPAVAFESRVTSSGHGPAGLLPIAAQTVCAPVRLSLRPRGRTPRGPFVG